MRDRDSASPAVAVKRKAMKENRFPPGWDENKMRQALRHYEEQSEDEAVAEDEAVFEDRTQTVMEVLTALVPAIRELLAKYQADIA